MFFCVNVKDKQRLAVFQHLTVVAVFSFCFVFLSVEPRFNEPRFNELLGITNNIFRPGKSYSNMYGTEHRFNEPRFNELPLTKRFRYNEQRSSQVVNIVVDIAIDLLK